jgi:nitroreductase
MLMDIIKSRHSIRKYKNKQIERKDLELILEAGNFAPNAGGGQRSMMVAIHDAEMTKKVGLMNMATFNRNGLIGSYVSKEQPSVIDDPSIKDGFYGAPAVVAIFAQNNFMFRVADAFCMAENMVLQATELGIASCIISRGEETFRSEEGQKLLEEWEVPKNYTCQCFVILGYLDGDEPQSKPRKPGRIKIVEK